MSVRRPRSLLAFCIVGSSLVFGCTSGNDAPPATAPQAAAHTPPAVGPELQAQLLAHAMLAFRAQDGIVTGGSRTHHATIRDGAIELTPYTFVAGERTAHSPITLATSAISVGRAPLASGTSIPTIDDGDVVIPRGPAIERLRNQVDGLHQEWAFTTVPASGDLAIDVAVSGYRYLTSTAGGLHFAGDNVMVRYSHATWRGADGRSWPIAASYDASGGHIHLTVPANVIAVTRFPAVLDPTISAEVAVDSPVTTPTGAPQQQVAIAFGGSEYLAVWADNRDSNNADVWGTRLSSDGTVLDTLGIQIAAAPGNQSNPAVVFDGSAFVVAWEDFQANNSTVAKVTAARVSTSGTVTALGTVGTSTSSQTTPNLASAGGGSALLVWNTAGEIDGAVVSSSIGSTVTVATGALVERPSVASNPSGDYLVGYTVTNHLTGQLVTAAGALDGTAITISAPPSGAQTQSDATFDGTNYDVVWRNGADAHVYGTRVSPAGAVLDTRTVGTMMGVGGIAVNASPAQAFRPTIACQSTGCLVVWHDQRNLSSTSFDLYGQLLTLSFTLSGTPITVSQQPGPQEFPALASNGAGYFLAWTDNRTNASSQAYGATISSTGTVGTDAPIGTGNNRESSVAIGRAGTDSAMFWRDSRGGPSIYYVRYDSAGNALDTVGRAVQTATGSQNTPEATADLGGNTLVVWADTRNGSTKDIYGARVDLSTGTTVDASGIAISTAASDQIVPAVASNGSVALVVWQDFRNGNFDIYGAVVNSSGAVTVSDIAVCTATGAQDNPSVTWDAASSQFIVSWQDARSGTFQVYGARVDTSGAVLDANGVALVASASAQSGPALASTATGTLDVWQDGNHIRGTRLTGGTSLGIVDTSGIAISSTASNQGAPKLGLLGGSYFVVWSDDRAGNQDIYGQLVAGDGSLSGTEIAISTSTDDEVSPTVSAVDASSARVAYEARRLDTSRAVSRLVTNAIESIAVTPANTSIPKGTTQQYTATATFSDGSTADVTASVTWSSSDPTIATISSTGLATAVATGGPITITATSGTVSGSTGLTVTPPALASIAVTPVNPTSPVGFKVQFVATGTFTDGSTQNVTSTVTWASSNTAVATISNTNGTRGQATVVGVGPTTISATQGTIMGSTTLTGTNTVTLTSIAVTPNPLNLNVGQKRQLKATGTFSDGSQLDITTQVSWSSNNTAVATVGASGAVTAQSLGTATVTATKGTVSGTTTVNVVPPSLVSITVTPASPVVTAGNTQAFTATGKLSDGSTQDLTATATWTSSNTAVATMAGSTATAVAKGTATITATSGTVSGSTTMTVTATNLVSIAITPADSSVAAGYQEQLVATGTFMDGSKMNLTAQVAWSSSVTTVATVSNVMPHGMATVVGVGATTVSATLNGITGTTTLTGTNATLTSITVSPASFTLAVGAKKALRATGGFSDGTQLDVTSQVTWSSSDTGIATVGKSGVVTAVASGGATITAARSSVTGTSAVTVP